MESVWFASVDRSEEETAYRDHVDSEGQLSNGSVDHRFIENVRENTLERAPGNSSRSRELRSERNPGTIPKRHRDSKERPSRSGQFPVSDARCNRENRKCHGKPVVKTNSTGLVGRSDLRKGSGHDNRNNRVEKPSKGSHEVSGESGSDK